MSGGSYEYAYMRIEDLADSIRKNGGCSCASPALRMAFVAHLRLVARAARAIEWNDSSDGDDREIEAIRKCVAPDVDGGELALVQQNELDRLRAIVNHHHYRTKDNVFVKPGMDLYHPSGRMGHVMAPMVFTQEGQEFVDEFYSTKEAAEAAAAAKEANP